MAILGGTQKLKDTLVWVTGTQATAHKSSRTLLELEKIFVKKKKVTSLTYMTHFFLDNVQRMSIIISFFSVG